MEPWWNSGGTLVEPSWNPSWNLTSGPPRPTPEPIWAKTPKLSAQAGQAGQAGRQAGRQVRQASQARQSGQTNDTNRQPAGEAAWPWLRHRVRRPEGKMQPRFKRVGVHDMHVTPKAKRALPLTQPTSSLLCLIYPYLTEHNRPVPCECTPAAC